MVAETQTILAFEIKRPFIQVAMGNVWSAPILIVEAWHGFRRIRMYKTDLCFQEQDIYHRRMKTRGTNFDPHSKFDYSLRRLSIFLMLLCIYFGVWEITKRWVVDDLVNDPTLYCESPFPFVAVIEEIDYRNYRYLRRYHFVCLGLKAKLPFASVCHDRKPIVMGGVIPRIIIQDEEKDFWVGCQGVGCQESKIRP